MSGKNRMVWSILALCVFMTGVITLTAQLPPASFHHLKRDKEVMSSSYYTIAEDADGFIWFGSHDGGGLYRFDGYEIRSFLTDPERLNESMAGIRISRINSEIDSMLCIGTTFGFSLLNPVTGRIQNFNNSIDSVPDIRAGVTWAFVHDTLHELIWVGTRYGLASLDLTETKTFTFHRSHSAAENTDIPVDITDILLDQKDNNLLWIATYAGLYNYAIREARYSRFPCPLLEGKGMTITDVQHDPSGLIWIATREGNVISYDHKSNLWKVYPVRLEGLQPGERNDIYRILPDQTDALWLSTHRSVGRLNLTSGDYEAWQYNPEHPDGLLQSHVYRDMTNDRHGRMWVASWNGVQYAKQAYLPLSNKVDDLRVAITEVNIVPIFEDLPQPLLYEGTLELRKEQRDITFQFVLPNPLDADRVEYQYMLKGYDKNWISTDQRRVRYPRLNGGHYRFLVRGKEGDNGTWLPETRLDIVVAKRINEYWWFWAILVGLGALIAVLVYRLLLSNVRKQERLKAEFESKLSEIEMQALRAQMNPHFLFNSLNSIKYYAITKTKDETATYLSKFALLVRAILNNSKSRTISLKDELDALQLYIEIEHLRLEGKFDYLIDIDSGIHIRQAQIPPMILQPYVENAIWHGLMHKDGRGKLLVQVRDLGNQIQCIIEDNGIGRVRSAEIRKAQMDHKKSVGMQITSDRIALINRIYDIDTQVHVIDLADADGNAAGTRVVINIPLIKDEDE